MNITDGSKPRRRVAFTAQSTFGIHRETDSEPELIARSMSDRSRSSASSSLVSIHPTSNRESGAAEASAQPAPISQKAPPRAAASRSPIVNRRNDHPIPNRPRDARPNAPTDHDAKAAWASAEFAGRALSLDGIWRPPLPSGDGDASPTAFVQRTIVATRR